MCRLLQVLRLLSVLFLVSIGGCASQTAVLPSATVTGVNPGQQVSGDYLIGPGDLLQVFVWRNPDFSITVPVRPDGKISTPLVEDIVATGKRPTDLAREIEDKLKLYIKNPVVTVIVTEFAGLSSRLIRVVGEATQPRALLYREGLTLLDVMLEVGGLTDFAAGNRAVVVRNDHGKQRQIGVKLQNLLKGGDIRANIEMRAGDILIIPRSWF